MHLSAENAEYCFLQYFTALYSLAASIFGALAALEFLSEQAVESTVGRVLSRPALIVKSKHYNEQLRARHIHKATTHGSD